MTRWQAAAQARQQARRRVPAALWAYAVGLILTLAVLWWVGQRS